MKGMVAASAALVAARAAALALPPLVAPAFPDLNLLQWNPHWQCFAWNTNNCTGEAKVHLTRMLENSDIDFACLVEFEDPNYTFPENYSHIDSLTTCGHDFVQLIYNHQRWEPVSEPAMSSKGCMQLVPADRPYVIQEFMDMNTSEKVVVIAAHFPHPKSYTDTSKQEISVLRDNLAVLLNLTSTERVVLIADTNEFSTTSNRAIMEHLGAVSNVVVGTDLLQSCCFDNGFNQWSTFDRIIANFGAEMETTMLFDPLPEWAMDINNETKLKAAFHKAIVGKLLMHGTGRQNDERKKRIRWIIIGCVLGVAIPAAVILASQLRGRRRGQDEPLKDTSDDSDTSS